ncbi:hypothetical protein [Ruegeria conchae]|uniref:hypothetical protein n=1 Tax=Ruegeria conchae TaxID=981384 RepID=UPI0021A7CD24|nr:hypothetical protein [Ruegeria conchae]
MTKPNTLPSTHEVQSAIHRVRGTRVVLTEDRRSKRRMEFRPITPKQPKLVIG